jgi:hypothetical protein
VFREQTSEARRALYSTLAFLVGLYTVAIVHVMLNGFEGPTDAQSHAAIAVFCFVFGMAVDRWWALAFPAAYWVLFVWIWAQNVQGSAISSDVHPLMTFTLAACAVAGGIAVRRVWRRRPLAGR